MDVHEFAAAAIQMTTYTQVNPNNYYIYTDAAIQDNKEATAWPLA